MSRFFATLRWDVVRQYRHGLYVVSGFMVLVWGVLLGLLPGSWRADAAAIVPAFVVVNLIVTTFYFMAALVLLEKGEGVLSAVVTSPLRDTEYLISKLISLTVLALLETLLIVLLLFGAGAGWGLLGLGGFGLGVVYAIFGFIVISRFDSINEFLMPSAGIVMALMLPLFAHFGIVDRVWFYLHPVEPALTLMRAAYRGVAPGEIVYGVVGLLAWSLVCFVCARARFHRFLVRTVGA